MRNSSDTLKKIDELLSSRKSMIHKLSPEVLNMIAKICTESKDY